jgi:hypothetical protein
MVQCLAIMDRATTEVVMQTYWLASNRTVIVARITLKIEIS